MAVAPFTPGFSDSFAEFAVPGYIFADQNNINQMFDRVGHYNARTLRFTVRWDRVETSPGTYDWSFYNHLILHAYYRGLKLLPVVMGAPSWVSRTQIAGGDPNFYYPNEPGHSAYGNFVAETLNYLTYFGVCRAVEVWNEPNLAAFGPIPASTFKSMLASALASVNGRTYPVAVTVISGGLYMDWNGGNGAWKNYLSNFMAQCYPYAVGIHPYALGVSGNTRVGAVANLVNRVKAFYQATSEIVTTDIWVTEFGSGSDAPFGEQGKADALVELAGANGYFAGRARCKGVFVYRFFPQATFPDNAPQVFATYPVLRELTHEPSPSFEELEPTHYYLQQNWAGAPG